MVLLVTILLGVSAVSAAETNENTTTDNISQKSVETHTEGNTNIESNSIKNTVSNEYETITNEISSTDNTISKKANNATNTKTSNDKPEVIITTEPITAYSYQLITIKANVTYQNGENVSDAKTAIKINGKTIGKPRVTDGLISFDFEVPKWRAEEYNLTIIVGETSNTATTRINSSLFIQRHDVNIQFEDINISSAAKTTIKANVTYENGTVANGTKAVFKINGKTIGSTLVKNGVASIDYIVPNKANTYPLILKIGESTVSNYNETTVNLVVNKRNPTVTIDSLIFAQSNSKVTLKAQLTDIGYANASGKIGFKINGKTVATVQMVNSTAEYIYDVSHLKSGSHVVSIVYGGSSALYEVRKNTTLRVQSQFVKNYTYEQVLEKAVSTYNFIINNKMLPNYALMSGNQVSMADLLYMLAQVVTYNNSYHNGGFSLPSTTTYTSEYGILMYEEDYVPLAYDIVNSYIANGSAPKNIKTKSGLTLNFADALFCFTKAVSFIVDDNNNRLPTYVGVSKINDTSYGSTSSSGSDSSPSTDSSSSSQPATDIVAPSGYGEYLVKAKNADINTTTIINAVKSALSGVSGLYNQAKAIFNYVNDKTDYSSYFDTRYGAIGTLTRGYGNCVDQSHLLLGMYRTAQIPARYCHATCYFTSGLVVGHVWVEVYVNGKWYSCDTTSNRNSFGVINNWYKSSSVKRYNILPF